MKTYILILSFLCCAISTSSILAQPDTLWTQTFGGIDEDVGYSVQPTSDGGYIVAGYTWSFSAGYTDVYLIKTDASGNQQWSQTFGGSGDNYGKNVQQTSDGGYIIAGTTAPWGTGFSDVYLIRTDASGNEQWSQTFGGSSTDCGYSVRQTSDGGYIIAGDTYLYIYPGISDVYLIKTATDPVSPVKSIQTGVVPEFSTLYPPHPNPFNPTTTLTFTLPSACLVNLEVFDINACRVGVGLAPTRWYPPGTHHILFDGSGMASGVYLARLTAGDFTQTQKLVLLK